MLNFYILLYINSNYKNYYQAVIHYTLHAEMVDYIEETTTKEPTEFDVETIVDISPKIDVKIRKGEYIIKMAKTGTDETSIESCLETALKILYFLQLKMLLNLRKTKDYC